MHCHDNHDSICENFDTLRNVIRDIEEKAESKDITCDAPQRGDLLYDVKKAKGHVEEWKAHVFRSENQDLAKQDASNSILIFLAWAMKFVQMKYREKQSEWFGKRGINWHISSVVARNTTGSLEVTSYAHLFDACTQDWFAVLSINENLLHINKAVRPSITEAYLRSGEAGCYYNNFLIAALKDVGQRAGINIRRYDFSEQQHGKDMCDRILCPMKAICKDSVTRATTSHLPVT